MPANFPTRPAVRRCASAGVLVLALFGSGPPVTATAPSAQPDLTRFYRQKVSWSACRGTQAAKDMQCGKVTVPLDYARPDAGTLDLALARYRATGPSQGSVVLNFGGPGGAGISSLAASSKAYLGLTNGYDVVTFDPRGVGRSSPVSCGEGASGTSDTTQDGAARRDPRALMALLRKEAAECTRFSGPVLSHIGTVNASRDLDVMRQALGDDRLNYLGFSYGTRLGAVYAAQFPSKVGRMALDGVDTLTEPLAKQARAGAEGQQTALDEFLDWCVKDLGCPFGRDRRAAGDQVLKLVRSLDARPLATGFGGRLTGRYLVSAIGQGLYSEKLWPSLERAVVSLVDDGDTRAVQRLATGGLAPSKRSNGGLVDQADVPTDNLSAAMMAINCADDPDRPGSAQITEDFERLRASYEEASPVFGPYRLAELLMCYGRDKGTDFIRERVRNVDSAKLLLVGTRGDPATPYRWTTETADRLGPSAVVLDNKGGGHTGYSSSTCVHRKIDDFLLYGSLPADGSSCPADRTG
jgi:pimeloyl-ACP methyl ester carboxylesterase